MKRSIESNTVQRHVKMKKRIQLTHGNSKWNSGILNIYDILQLIVKLLANNIDVINASAGIGRENREKSKLVAIKRRTE